MYSKPIKPHKYAFSSNDDSFVFRSICEADLDTLASIYLNTIPASDPDKPSVEDIKKEYRYMAHKSLYFTIESEADIIGTLLLSKVKFMKFMNTREVNHQKLYELSFLLRDPALLIDQNVLLTPIFRFIADNLKCSAIYIFLKKRRKELIAAYEAYGFQKLSPDNYRGPWESIDELQDLMHDMLFLYYNMPGEAGYE